MAPVHDLLARLPPDDQRRVLAETRRRRFKRGEVLFHEGDPADTVHLVEVGRVAVRVTTALGDEATLDVFGPGTSIGELALVHRGEPRSATVIALEPVETRVLTATAFDVLRAEHRVVDDVLFELLARRVRALSARVSEAYFVAADVRVLRRLLDVGAMYAPGATDAGDRRTPVLVPLTQEDLAGLAGTTRETVNRVLRREEERGALALGRGKVTLLDIPALRQRAR